MVNKKGRLNLQKTDSTNESLEVWFLTPRNWGSWNRKGKDLEEIEIDPLTWEKSWEDSNQDCQNSC